MTAVEIFKKDADIVKVLLKSQDDVDFDAKIEADSTITQVTDGYLLTLSWQGNTSYTPASQPNMSYAVGCITTTDFVNMICLYCGEKKNA